MLLICDQAHKRLFLMRYEFKLMGKMKLNVLYYLICRILSNSLYSFYICNWRTWYIKIFSYKCAVNTYSVISNKMLYDIITWFPWDQWRIYDESFYMSTRLKSCIKIMDKYNIVINWSRELYHFHRNLVPAIPKQIIEKWSEYLFSWKT